MWAAHARRVRVGGVPVAVAHLLHENGCQSRRATGANQGKGVLQAGIDQLQPLQALGL